MPFLSKKTDVILLFKETTSAFLIFDKTGNSQNHSTIFPDKLLPLYFPNYMKNCCRGISSTLMVRINLESR